MITISSQTFFEGAYRYGGSTATVRIYANKPFIAADGTAVPGGKIGSVSFFKAVACTILSGTLTVPSFTVPSTTDALDDQTARFSFVLYDSKGGKRDILYANIKGGQLAIPSNLGSTLTFAQIAISNQAQQPLRDTSVYTKTETNTQIALAAGELNDASDSVKGRTKLSVAPASSANPIAVGDNDPRNTDARTPTGAAGGSLAGTYPNPTIAALVVTDANVAAANKDGAAATPSMRTLGTGALQAVAGNDSRLSDARTPTDNSVTSAKIVDGTIVDGDIATANKDGAAGTPSMRTLGTGALQAVAGNDARIGADAPLLVTWPYTGDGNAAVGKPVKVSGAVAATTITTDTDGCVGIVRSGSSGQVVVVIDGLISSALFDTDMTGLEGYYVQISPTVNGQLHAIPSWPVSGQVIGRIRSVTNSSTTAVVDVFGSETRAGALLQSRNLSDLDSVEAARSNLLLGDAATKNVGAVTGTVMAGDDARVAESTSANLPNTIVKRGASGEVAVGLVQATQVESTGPMDTATEYRVDGVRVLTSQQASIANPTDAASTQARLIDLLAAIRIHGLIAGLTPPAAPTVLIATTFSSSRIDLSWTDNSAGAAGFKIEQSTDGTNFAQIGTNAAADVTYSATGLTQSTLYYFRVRAYNAQGDSAYTNTDSDTTSSGPVNPDAVAGLLFWYKADALALSNNDPVSSWTDSSGNANHATQATAAKKPLFKTNQINTTLPVVRFDGSDDFLQFTQLTNIQSLFVVMKHATGSQDYTPILGDPALYNWSGWSAKMLIGPNGSVNISTNAQGYVNGQLDTVANLLKPTTYRLIEIIGAGPTTATYLTNDRNAPGRYWNGDYVEVIGYSTAVGAGDRQGLEQYFANKYGADVSATAVLRNKVIFVGDSLTGAGLVNQTVNALVGDPTNPGPVLNLEWFGAQYQTSGYTLELMAAYDTNVASERNASRVKQAVVLWGGGNDIYYGASSATAQTRLIARVDAYQAAGWGVAGAPIVIVTALPRSNSGTPVGYEAARQTFNQWIRDNAVAQGFVVADVGNDATIGQAGQETNTTYYTDLVHQTGAGQFIVAASITAAINAAP